MASSASSPNSMHVAVEVVCCKREVHVYNVFHPSNIKATCCHIGGNKHSATPLSELAEPAPTDIKRCLSPFLGRQEFWLGDAEMAACTHAASRWDCVRSP